MGKEDNHEEDGDCSAFSRDAVIGKGYSNRELEQTVDFLRRELLLVPDVAKVTLWGVQKQEVYVEISRDRLARLVSKRED